MPTQTVNQEANPFRAMWRPHRSSSEAEGRIGRSLLNSFVAHKAGALSPSERENDSPLLSVLLIFDVDQGAPAAIAACIEDCVSLD